MTFRERLVASWYAPAPTRLAVALSPAAWLFAAAASLRRTLYRVHALTSTRVGVPVVVIGNITVGGTGKTPVVAALARALRERGFVPGIVSRGYGRRTTSPRLATAASDAADVGDEPLLLARAGWPVAVAADRALAARMLIDANPRCDVIVCDDGLQHYALARDVEVAVVDGGRGLGNGLRLPAGPLREPPARLASVDAVVVLQPCDPRPDLGVPSFAATLAAKPFRRVNAPQLERAIDGFTGTRVHALAGIGAPQRFFDTLAALGCVVDAHPYPDHHKYVASELAFDDSSPIVMTEKDAVKCERFADDRCWYLPVEAILEPALVDRIAEKLTWTRSSSKSSSAR